MFANELFVAATSHKPERIRLDKNQIALLESRGKDHTKVNGTECFCLDEENGEAECCLPCCYQCIHFKCAVTHFKRQVDCPYCKKDLRTVLEESPEKKQKVEGEEDDSSENSEPDENNNNPQNLMDVINNVREQILNQRGADMNILGEILNLAADPEEDIDYYSDDSSYNPGE